MMKKLLFTLIAICIFTPVDMDAQCAMCRAALESSSDNSAGAVNDGIVYLMAFPYLLMGGLGYIIFRVFRKKSTATNS